MPVAVPPAIVRPMAVTPSAAELQMLNIAHLLLYSVKDNRYTFVADIEPQKGIFHADCSAFVDYLAAQVDPQAYKLLPLDAGHSSPRADNLYDYLSAQAPVQPGQATKALWGRIATPAALAPGDVIAWENPHYVPMHSSTGHVMLVDGQTFAIIRNGHLLGYDVPVIDSTAHGHGPQDSRRAGQSGIGTGTIFVPVDANGVATGFGWAPEGTPGAKPPRSPAPTFGRLLR